MYQIQILRSDPDRNRRTLLKAAISSVALCPLLATAQTVAEPQRFPERPVKLVCPFPAGGIVDISSRRVAEALGAAWATSIVVDNKGGAAGILGASMVAQSPPDGHTLMLTLYDTLVIASAAGRKLSFDPATDLVPIALIGDVDTVFLVPHGSPDGSLRAFMARAKANPLSVNFGSIGIGSSFHLALEQLKNASGANLGHVPFSGGTPMFTEMMGGRLDGVMSSLLFAMPYIKDGRFRALAVSGSARSPLLPNVPSMDEAGFPGISVPYALGLFAARNTRQALVHSINRDTVRILNEPSMKARFAGEGVAVSSITPEQFATRFRQETAAIAKVIKQNKLDIAS